MLLVALLCSCVLAIANSQDNCGDRTTCGDCISLSECVWCENERYNGTTHCVLRGFDVNCPPEDIVDPLSEAYVEETDLLDFLVSPQVVNVTLRPGSPAKFNVTVLSANNFPLDFYMLIDVSSTLSDDHAQIRSLSSQITDSLGNISTNYRIGFGTFVDKSTTPFYAPRSVLEEFNVCSNGARECIPPYSYRHALTLTNDNTLFSERLDERLRLSLGADEFEGGFDAIVQAIACQSLIGWRPQARKILLFVTDSGSHTAGDGKLGGITRPNDLQCHMESSGGGQYHEYYNWNVTDYPSIGQIRQLLIDSNTVLLFGVTQNLNETYSNLQQELEGSFVGVLEADSNNFIAFIEEQYEIVRGTISLRTPQVPNLSVEINPIEGCDRTQGSFCDNVPIEQRVTFEVSLVGDDCSFDDYNFDITISGFGRVPITVNSLCECDCEDDPIPSSLCLNDGDLVCGVCECSSEVPYLCPVSEISNEQCSGRGSCDSCGQCSCDTVNGVRYYGDACQCGDQTCPAPNGVICEGRGDCCEGRCVCTALSPGGAPYTGDACECNPDVDRCVDKSGLVCGGRGECVCNQCQCNDEYTGNVCQTCRRDSCQSCSIYRNCALCAHNVSTECDNCSSNVIISLVDLNEVEVEGSDCEIFSGQCLYNYYVQENENLTGQFLFSVGLTPDCRSDSSSVSLTLVYILVPIIFVGIVLAGIIVLIAVKLAMMFVEAKEVRRFQLETNEASWAESDNPLYVNPSQKYTNIAYRPKRRSRKGSHQ